MEDAGQRLTTTQKLGQRIVPWQMQLVPLLVMNGLEIHDQIARELAGNPALEVKSDPDEQNLEKTEDGETYRESPDEMQRKD